MQNAEQFKGIPVCRITGAFGKFMAEYVLAYVLYFCQDIPGARGPAGKEMDPFRMEFIHQKTLGVMGLGNIGKRWPESPGCGDAVVSWDMAPAEAPFVERQFDHGDECFFERGGFCSFYTASDPATKDLVGREFSRS